MGGAKRALKGGREVMGEGMGGMGGATRGKGGLGGAGGVGGINGARGGGHLGDTRWCGGGPAGVQGSSGGWGGALTGGTVCRRRPPPSPPPRYRVCPLPPAVLLPPRCVPPPVSHPTPPWCHTLPVSPLPGVSSHTPPPVPCRGSRPSARRRPGPGAAPGGAATAPWRRRSCDAGRHVEAPPRDAGRQPLRRQRLAGWGGARALNR